MYSRKNNSPRIFPACIGFVPRGIGRRGLRSWFEFCGGSKTWPMITNGKKTPKENLHKEFRRDPDGWSRRGLRRPNSLCSCWFFQQNTVHKEFQGGGSKGVLGVGSKVQFWGPISLCLCAFLGLDMTSGVQNVCWESSEKGWIPQGVSLQ